MNKLSAAVLFKIWVGCMVLLCSYQAVQAQVAKQAPVAAFSSKLLTPSHNFSGCTPGVSSNIICRGFAIKDFNFYAQLQVINTQGQTGQAGMGWGAATTFVIKPEKVTWLRFNNSYYYYANNAAMQSRQLSSVTITQNCQGRAANIRFTGKLKIFYKNVYAGQVSFQVANGLNGEYIFAQGKILTASLNLNVDDAKEAANRLYNFSYTLEVDEYEGHCECCDEIARAVAGGGGRADNTVTDIPTEKKKNTTVTQKQPSGYSSAVRFAEPYDITITNPAYPDEGNGKTDFEEALKQYNEKVTRNLPGKLQLPMNNQCAYENYLNPRLTLHPYEKSICSYQNQYHDCMAEPKYSPSVSYRYLFDLKDVESISTISQKGLTVSLCGLVFKAKGGKELFKSIVTEDGVKKTTMVSLFKVFLWKDYGSGCADLEGNDAYITANQLRIIACNKQKEIDASYNTQTINAYRAKNSDVTTRNIRFANNSFDDAEVRIYQPGNPGEIYKWYKFKRGESAYLGSPRQSVGADWGIQVVSGKLTPFIYPIGDVSYLQNGDFYCNAAFFEDKKNWTAEKINEYAALANAIDSYKTANTVTDGYVLLRNDLEENIYVEVFDAAMPFKVYDSYTIKPYSTTTIDPNKASEVMTSAWALRAKYERPGAAMSQFFIVGNLATVNNGSFYIQASQLLPAQPVKVAEQPREVIPAPAPATSASPFAFRYPQDAKQQKQVKQGLLISGEIRFYHGEGYTDDTSNVKVHIYKPENPTVPVYSITRKYKSYYDELQVNKKNITVKGNWGIQMERHGKKSKIYLIADIGPFAGYFLTTSPEFEIDGE